MAKAVFRNSTKDFSSRLACPLYNSDQLALYRNTFSVVRWGSRRGNLRLACMRDSQGKVSPFLFPSA